MNYYKAPLKWILKPIYVLRLPQSIKFDDKLYILKYLRTKFLYIFLGAFIIL